MSQTTATGKNPGDSDRITTETTSEAAWTPADDTTAGAHCRRCGRSIPPRVARVIGDNDRTVPVCKHCYENRNHEASPTTVAAVTLHRRDRRAGSADTTAGAETEAETETNSQETR